MLKNGHILDQKYEVIKVIGEGGMGTVYLCRNNRLGNLWAIKEIKSDFTSKVDFLAEPNILKNLNHPSIPRIVDIFYENDNLYMVEDYIEGQTLKEYVSERGSLTSEDSIKIALQLCSILEYLHSFDPPIIYRDLKPSNVMIKANKQIMLIDFGIARTYKEGQDSDTVILGSRGYIAPEQLINIQSNIQTDIYSLGATLYFMLTGKTPVSPKELLNDDSYPLNLNRNIIEVVKKAAAIEPQNRYKNIKDFHSDLQKYVNNSNYKISPIIDEATKEATVSKTAIMQKPRRKKKSKYIIVTTLIFVLALVFLLTVLASNKNEKQVFDTAPKNTSSAEIKTEVKKETEPPKEIVEKDTITKGIIYKDKAIVFTDNSTSNGKGKGKDKNKKKDEDEDKDYHILFNLRPASSISNSKFMLSITKLEIIEDYIIVTLSIENKTNTAINIDLSKTYLANGKNEAKKSVNSNSISVAQATKKEDIKLYFKDFDFKGSIYTLKTALSGGINKNINLSMEIK